MSDISFGSDWQYLLASPVIGWPGALVGAVLGALVWKRRRIAGAVIGALVGNFAYFAYVILT